MNGAKILTLVAVIIFALLAFGADLPGEVKNWLALGLAFGFAGFLL